MNSIVTARTNTHLSGGNTTQTTPVREIPSELQEVSMIIGLVRESTNQLQARLAPLIRQYPPIPEGGDKAVVEPVRTGIGSTLHQFASELREIHGQLSTLDNNVQL